MKLLKILALLAFSSSSLASGYLGDYVPGDTIDCKFTTFRPSTGAAFTLAGTPAVSAYKDNSTAQSTTGITLTADFDSVTGANHVRVTTGSDATFYSPGSHFELMITTGTVDSVSVVGAVPCSFSLRKVNLGQDASGTLSGTHSSTTADLGTNAPGATSQVAGMTLFIPAKHFSAVITSYNTGTGVATFPTTALTLADGDFWYLAPSPSTTFATDSINSDALNNNAALEIATALQTQALNTGTAGSVGERIGRVPNVAPGGNGGLPTTNASNQVTALLVPGTGSGQISLTSGAVTVGTNNDKTGYGLATDAVNSTTVAATGATEVAQAVATNQGLLTGTCSSGSTTTCVDAGRTEADATQIEDRLACFSDGWCGLITTFNPGTDTQTYTKVAPTTRASKTYTIFPSTLE
jgi:hypothetical protein